MKEKHNSLLLWPIIFALGFIPMIVHMYTYNCNLAQFDWFPDGSETQTDFFLYYKMVAIVITAGVMVCVLLYKLYAKKKDLKWNHIWFVFMTYAILVALSALFSDYKYFVTHGSYEVFESVWVVLGYVVLAFYTYQFVNNENDVKYIFKFAGIGMLIITVIGFLQYLGWDFFRTGFGKRLITNPSYWPQVDSLSFTFPLKTSYTTLYNTNYLAFYYGLLIPILAMLCIFSKGWKKKVVYGFLAILSLGTLIGSNSKSALLALAITALLACVLLGRYLKKFWWMFLVVIAAIIVLIASYANRLGGMSNLISLFTTGIDADISKNPVKDVQTNDSDIVFVLDDYELHFQYAADDASGYAECFVYDQDGNPMEYTYDETSMLYTLKLNDESAPACTFSLIYIDDKIGLNINIDNQKWYFAQLEDGYYYYNAFGKYVKTEHIEHSNLLKDGIFSGRGLLWNFLIPRLKNHIILGSGANTFTMVYPQNNYVNKMYWGSQGLFDVKAHSFYFQQWTENGLLALISIIVLYIWYFIQSFRIYFQQKEYTFTSIVGQGIFLGSFCYMISAVTNDSNVNTAPVFWILLGMGIAINEIVKKTNAEATAQ